MHKARPRQPGTRALCLSSFQCVRGVNSYYTLIYTTKGRNDVSVTFSKCRIRTEEEGDRTEVWDVSGEALMYSLRNLFIFIWDRLTGCALYQKHTSSLTLRYLRSFTRSPSPRLEIQRLSTQEFNLTVPRHNGPFLSTLGQQHQYARTVCHYALTVSLWPGHNVPIKMMSIEKTFLVFTFKLQHAFMRSAAFHAEWLVLMQTQSLGIQAGSCSARGKSKKMRKAEGWREGRKTRAGGEC